MKIIILQGSPNINGSTNLLVQSFTKGAEESGHTVERIDVSRLNVKPCVGCLACGYEGPCAQKDDTDKVKGALLSADMVVFATPVYYFGMTAQLKAVVDRFCAYNSSLHAKGLKSALLTVAWNSDAETFEPLIAHYKAIANYCHFKDQGMVIGRGCGSTVMTSRSGYIEEAYKLGKGLR